MEIVEMNHNDLDQVAKLCAQLGYPISMVDATLRFDVVSKLHAHKLFVAKEESTIIGWIHINIETPNLLSDARAEISGLVVDEKNRGKGIGKELINKAEDWAKGKNINLIRLRSNLIREDAHKFYHYLGYSIKKSWHLFVKSF